MLQKVEYNWEKFPHNQMEFICGSHEVIQSMLTLTPQNYHHDHMSIYMFDTTPHFFCGRPLPGNTPHKARERVYAGPQKNSSAWQVSCS